MEETKSLKRVDVPDGKYQGIQGGYELEIALPNGTLSAPIKLNNGIRCMDCGCLVEIIDGWAYVREYVKRDDSAPAAFSTTQEAYIRRLLNCLQSEPAASKYHREYDKTEGYLQELAQLHGSVLAGLIAAMEIHLGK